MVVTVQWLTLPSSQQAFTSMKIRQGDNHDEINQIFAKVTYLDQSTNMRWDRQKDLCGN